MSETARQTGGPLSVLAVESIGKTWYDGFTKEECA